MGAERILVVEDDASLRLAVQEALGVRYSRVDVAATGRAAVERLAHPGVEPYDVVISDLRLPGAPGLAVLRAALDRSPQTAVLLMSAYGSIDSAVDAMRLGALDFIQKPFALAQLEERVERALEGRALARDPGAGDHEIAGESRALRSAIALAERVAVSPSTVLLTGETGTGKEAVAALIHRRSRRADRPFVKVNCAALPETLLESELFGHERGAFTGADQRRIGRFEDADGGTLFLDEVADMSPATQAKLLRVLQEGEFHRLGGGVPLHTDVRIVAATNRDLEAAIRDREFREDLYFRINVIRVHLPPLRDRGSDIQLLVSRFLEEFGRARGRGPLSLSAAAAERLRRHPWPGNVRELRNVVERAVLLADGPRVEASDIGLAGAEGERGWEPALPPGGLSLDEVERAVVVEALERTGYVQKDAAALLGVSRRRLNYKVQRMGITHESWRRNRAESEPAP